MPAQGQNYIIAGAGITGLTLALALAKFGASVTVLERNDAVQEFGAGLQISPNARHVLNDLGLDDALSAVSFEPKALDTYAAGAGRPIVSLELGGVMRDRFDAPYAVMHRADLAQVLYKATRRFANIDIIFGVRRFGVVSDARGIACTFEDNTGTERQARARAFIGADGVHSLTRRELLEGPEAQFGARVAWRALVPIDAVQGVIPHDRVSVFFGRGCHLVCYPLPHRNQVNLALFLPSSTSDVEAGPAVPRPGGLAQSVLAVAMGRWTGWPLFTVNTDRWFRGNVGLAGDAAHAMVPFQAQGAAMGIEDAGVLAPLLVAAATAEEGFGQYSRMRQERVTRVAALSSTNGKIFHLYGPAAHARNAVMRLQGPQAHLKRLAWIYGYKAVAGAS
ncbi:FAD-dependent monooxygenase [Devosia sp. PTR5]|uniref:FAD-dependent monooxygenase n=1 Tax=Devosia oryzisoli TaxID=2774138 RepID=A0A927FQG5_9HYPH|nr:FAD-dependent monooxygenase [Devosia oryzisoli]MBD8064370.1 FAD-dependent monooxygenase [Devosia oryzisoli]